MSLPPALVVLAAGASERLGEAKALARLREGPRGSALELLLAAGAALGDAHPLVVAGRDAGRIASLARRIEGTRVEVAHHPRWSEGRTGSVQLACERRAERDLCLAPVDVPLVPGEVFAALAREWARLDRPARGWLAPFVDEAGGRRFGHPLIVGRELLRTLKGFPPDRPLSDLRACAAPLLALAVASRTILDDLDTPEDLARLRERG